jgi:hypothetical protein
MLDRHGLTAQLTNAAIVLFPNYSQHNCKIWCYIYYLTAVGSVSTDLGSSVGAVTV